MRLLRWTARGAGAALVGFHAWLLATQWLTGRLTNDPALLLQTTTVAGVIGAVMLALWLVVGIFRRRNTSHAAWSFVRVLSLSASPHDGFGLVVSARPPPAHN